MRSNWSAIDLNRLAGQVFEGIEIWMKFHHRVSRTVEPIVLAEKWRGGRDSNPRPPP